MAETLMGFGKREHCSVRRPPQPGVPGDFSALDLPVCVLVSSTFCSSLDINPQAHTGPSSNKANVQPALLLFCTRVCPCTPTCPKLPSYQLTFNLLSFWCSLLWLLRLFPALLKSLTDTEPFLLTLHRPRHGFVLIKALQKVTKEQSPTAVGQSMGQSTAVFRMTFS